MTRCWILDAGQIVDDLAPISRLEGDIFYRGYWMLEARFLMSSRPGTGSRFGKGIFAVIGKM